MKDTPIPAEVAAAVFGTANDVIRRGGSWVPRASSSSHDYSVSEISRFSDGYLVIARNDERIDLDEHGNACDEDIEGVDYGHYVALLALNKDLQTVQLTADLVGREFQGLEATAEWFKNEVLCYMSETDPERTRRQADEEEAEIWAADHGFEGVCGDTSPETYREWAYMNDFEPARAVRLDAVMEEVKYALYTDEETQLLKVEKQEAGYWVIDAPNDVRLAFDVMDSDALDVVALHHYWNRGEGSRGSTNVSLKLDDLTVRKAIELVVDKLRYGLVDDILAGPLEEFTLATYVLSVRSGPGLGGNFKASAQLRSESDILQRIDFSGPDKAEVVLAAKTAIWEAIEGVVALDEHDDVASAPRETYG